mgnify:CR=1 FL=1
MTRRARKVRLHLISGETMEGLMTRRLTAGHYVLNAPRFLETEERTLPLEGTVEVHRNNVRFVQVLR